MAGDWIAMRTDLYEESAVAGIALSVGLDEFAVVGRLHRFWSYADRQTADGKVPHITAEWIDRLVSCPGFAMAMHQVGWLTVNKDGVVIPKFDRWMSRSAKARLGETQGRSFRRQKMVASGQMSGQTSGQNPDQRRGEKRKGKKSPGGASPGTPLFAEATETTATETAEALKTPPDHASGKAPDTPAPSKARECDDLFDAIAEVTSSDPKASGSNIGRVKKALLQADPPYTADEVRQLPALLPWLSGPLTLGKLQEMIGRVRAPRTPAPTNGGHHGPRTGTGSSSAKTGRRTEAVLFRYPDSTTANGEGSQVDH